MILQNEFIFSDFKKLVLASAESMLFAQGFNFIKSQICFRKKMKSGKIEVAFDFLNYPDNYEYSFCIILWNNLIQDITKQFHEYSGIKDPVKWTTTYFEGDFVESLKQSEGKFRKAYYNKANSLQQAKDAIQVTLNVINNKALPLAYSTFELKDFQDYYISHISEVIINFDNTELFISFLLSMYLKSEADYWEKSTYLKSQIDIEKSKGNHYEQLYYYLDLMNKFVKKE